MASIYGRNTTLAGVNTINTSTREKFNVFIHQLYTKKVLDQK